MKRNYLMTALCLLWTINANALIVNVDEHGQIEENLEITINEAEEDPLSEKMQMNIEGSLLCSGTLTVTISRSSEGLEDVFCCAKNCIGGNGQTSQTMTFTPSGVADWFIHYTPAPNSHETVVYTFTDSTESKRLTVHYNNDAEGVEVTGDGALEKSRKILRDGIIYIINDNKIYHL